MSVAVWRTVGELPPRLHSASHDPRSELVTVARTAEESAARLDSHLILLEDPAERVQIAIGQETGTIPRALWREEEFQIAPGFLVAGQPAVVETKPGSYLFTPERVPDNGSVAAGPTFWPNGGTVSLPDVTLIARGVSLVPHAAPDATKMPARYSWTLQLTYSYDPASGLLATWLRPAYVRVADAPPDLDSGQPASPGRHGPGPGEEAASASLDLNLQIRWNLPWTVRQERAVRSPGGAWVIVPQQADTDMIATQQTVTVHRRLTARADQTAPLLVLIWLPPTTPASLPTGAVRTTVDTVDTLVAAMCQQLRLESTSGQRQNGLPVFASPQQALAWLQLRAPADWRLQAGVSPAPATPGRYQLIWELTPPGGLGQAVRAPWRVALPFRLWPAAVRAQAQADFAQLLLSCDLGDDFLVAHNFVQPRHIYRAEDRDDVLAETGRIAFTLADTLGDPDLRWLAWRMAARLLHHQQPDGGFTFGVSVNGFRADYCDTDADVVQFLLALAAGRPPLLLRRQVLLRAAIRAAEFICTYQDPTGFFWGRTDRPSQRNYGQQPWFTSYSVVALLEVNAQPEVPPPPRERFLQAAVHGLNWLCQVQADDGHLRFDTEGPYADYDDLSNTSVATWALARAVELLPDHPDASAWWQAAQRGVRYLLTLELPAHPGQFTGRQLAGLEKLVYDYRLGSAFDQYLRSAKQLQSRKEQQVDGRQKPAHAAASGLAAQVRAAYQRYRAHIRWIQGNGTTPGGWGSLYLVGGGSTPSDSSATLAPQPGYAMHFDWFERGSAWQEYVFLGWQGKLILMLNRPLP